MKNWCTQYFRESRIKVKTNICENNNFLNPDFRWKPKSVNTLFLNLKPRFSCKSTSVNVDCEFQCSAVQFIFILRLELKRNWSKVKVFEMLGPLTFRWLNWRRKKFSTKIIVHGGTFLKSVSEVGFLGKLSSWENVFFHCDRFGVTNFGLVLSICIANALIFINKNA